MSGKISEMTDGGAGQDTDRIEITRDPLGTPVTRFQSLAGIKEHIDAALAHGIMSVQAGVTGEAVVDATMRKIAAWNVDGLEKNMTVDSTTGKDITADVDGVYIVVANISFSGTNSKTFQLEIFKNGVATGFAIDRKLGSGGDVGAAPIIGLLSLVATDTVEVFQSSPDGGAALTVSEAQLSVVRISS